MTKPERIVAQSVYRAYIAAWDGAKDVSVSAKGLSILFTTKSVEVVYVDRVEHRESSTAPLVDAEVVARKERLGPGYYVVVSVDTAADTDEARASAKVTCDVLAALVALSLDPDFIHERLAHQERLKYPGRWDLRTDVYTTRMPKLLKLSPVQLTDFQSVLHLAVGKSAEAATRALRWYLKGLLENDQSDRFVSFWIAIESLSPRGVKTVNHAVAELSKLLGHPQDAVKDYSGLGRLGGLRDKIVHEGRVLRGYEDQKLIDRLQAITEELLRSRLGLPLRTA